MSSIASTTPIATTSPAPVVPVPQGSWYFNDAVRLTFGFSDTTFFEDDTLKFNNAVQKAFGNMAIPRVLVWQTNDPETPWSAEARVVGQVTPSPWKLGSASSKRKYDARDEAAREGYEALCNHFPEIDFD